MGNGYSLIQEEEATDVETYMGSLLAFRTGYIVGHPDDIYGLKTRPYQQGGIRGAYDRIWLSPVQKAKCARQSTLLPSAELLFVMHRTTVKQIVASYPSRIRNIKRRELRKRRALQWKRANLKRSSVDDIVSQLHEAPSINCSCGIYARPNIPTFAMPHTHQSGRVAMVVSLHGKIIEHPNEGWRAEKARILGILALSDLPLHPGLQDIPRASYTDFLKAFHSTGKNGFYKTLWENQELNVNVAREFFDLPDSDLIPIPEKEV